MHETLVGKGFEFVRPPAIYRGPLPVHGKLATVELTVADITFARLPSVKLIDATKLPVSKLAHLIGDGDICYVGESGLPLDFYDPGGSILRVLLDAAAALERSFGGKADEEFERELASYWLGGSVYFAVDRPLEPAVINAEAIAHTADDDSGVLIVPKEAWKERSGGLRSPATVLSFREGLKHTASFPLSHLSAALAYIGSQADPPRGWREAVISAAATGSYLFLAAPNAIIGWLAQLPPGLSVIVGRSRGFRKGFLEKVLEQSLEQIGLHRVTGKEVDLRFCVERNLGGAPSLAGKTIAMIGCGTIGGYLSRMLVQNGAGLDAALHLYDFDSLSAGNLGRHLLGFNDLGRNKAEALAAHLRGFHPDVAVQNHGVDATKEWAELEKADLIIDATGEENVSTALNHAFLRSSKSGERLALLHSWIFGNGVAAQSFLNLKDGGVCYRCLRTGFGGQWRYSPLKDPNSPVRQAPGRCGEGGYIPFATDASTAAAGLAIRAALDWASGKPGLRLRTVIVDHEQGREKVPWVSPERLPNCPACHT